MDRVLNDFKWTECLVYFDDIVVIPVGKTFQEPVCHLGNVLLLAGLKHQTAKCNFCQPKVRFSGHIISAKGVAAIQKRQRFISNWPTPTDKRHVQQFLGLADYYRWFIKTFHPSLNPCIG